MPASLTSSRTLQRHRRLAGRLMALFEQLGAVENRRAPLPPAVAGRARRTLAEIEAALGTPLCVPPGTRMPSDLFIGTVLGIEALAAHKRLTDKAVLAKYGKTYPRRSERE
jgi:hypothetical protein